MNDKVLKQGLRLSTECLFLASMEATYKDIVEQHKGARQRFNIFMTKHKGVN